MLSLLKFIIRCYSIISDPKSRKFGKIRMAFERITPRPHRFRQSVGSSKEYEQRISRQYYPSKAFDSIHRGKTWQILLAHGFFTTLMLIFRNTKAMVRSPDEDTDFWNIVAEALQRNTLAPYLFIPCQDYIFP